MPEFTDQPTPSAAAQAAAPSADTGSVARGLIRLARPTQWAKSGFVVIGPAYGFADAVAEGMDPWGVVYRAVMAAMAFALASSGCYVLNDLSDREADRAHPRKRHRPLASGLISPGQGVAFTMVLFAIAALCIGLTPPVPGCAINTTLLLAILVSTYVINVLSYSAIFKQRVIADVMSLSLGFVIRVGGGCAAVGIEPSSWLLNATLFLAMFLAFGKRLGERRTLGDDHVAAHRAVQGRYTDNLLRMAVVVTGVTSLMTYAIYVQGEADTYTYGFNLLWLTMLPATYALLRAIVLLEQGKYDDPTELAVHDLPFQVAAFGFGLVTALLMVARIWGEAILLGWLLPHS